MPSKASSTAGTRKDTRQCGTNKLEYCPTDDTPITLQNIVDQMIANGATFGDGTAIPGNVIGTDIEIDAISVTAYDTGIRAQDSLTNAIVEGTECGLTLVNNGSTTVVEASETSSTDEVYDDFAIAAIAGTACFQLDITFASV